MIDELPQRAYQLVGSVPADHLLTNHFVDVVEFLGQLLFVEGYGDTSQFGKALSGRQLMVVAVLSQVGAAGHDENRFGHLHGHQYGPCAGVRDDGAGGFELLLELIGIEEGH